MIRLRFSNIPFTSYIMGSSGAISENVSNEPPRLSFATRNYLVITLESGLNPNFGVNILQARKNDSDMNISAI